MLQNEIESILKPVIAKERIVNAKVRILGANQKGDGYLGVVTAVEVKGDNKTLKLILKTAPKSVELRKQLPIREVFNTEINFYTKVYPALRKFQIENEDIKPFISIAKCFAASTEEMAEALVFQNLKEIGFELYDRKKTMDKEHVAFVLEEYGRLHALSYALRDQNRELLHEMSQNMEDVVQLLVDNKDFADVLAGVVDKVRNIPEIKDKPKLMNVLDNYANTYIEFFKSLSSKKADQYAVLLHGDCWCNNMMFKYEDHNNPKVPTSMRLIDWQLQRLGSPVLDLSYFLYACASKEIFNNLDECLKIYHDSLSAQLKKLGSNPDTLLPFNVLKDQWKIFGRYGMNFALLVIRIMLSDSEEAPDLMAAAEDGQSVMQTFDFECKHEEEYKRRVADVVLHCWENKFI